MRRCKFSGTVLILKRCSPSLETSTLGASDSTGIKHSRLDCVHTVPKYLLSTNSHACTYVLLSAYYRESNGNWFLVLDWEWEGERTAHRLMEKNEGVIRHQWQKQSWEHVWREGNQPWEATGGWEHRCWVGLASLKYPQKHCTFKYRHMTLLYIPVLGW